MNSSCADAPATPPRPMAQGRSNAILPASFFTQVRLSGAKREMKIEDLNERLRDSVLIGDGAMGSMLYELLGPQRCLDELNSTQAEAVFRVHQTYLEAGAQIIETNTFGANRHKLAALGLGDHVGEFNHRGVKIAREAREAARHEVLIAGSIGPLGTLRQGKQLPPDEIHEIFRERPPLLKSAASIYLFWKRSVNWKKFSPPLTPFARFPNCLSSRSSPIRRKAAPWTAHAPKTPWRK